jgi:hypothetical protein
MSLPHIPVRIIACDPAENLAFSDVLSGGQAGVLALAAERESPLAVLVTPSGDPAQADGKPAVVLGVRGETPEGARVLPVPARLAEVLEALESLASETSGLSDPRSYGGWRLEPAHLRATRPNGEGISLTDTECRLLACLFDAQGGTISREALLQRVWGYRPGLDTHTLETHIYRLRKKIEADPANPGVIVTTESGYRFVP